MRVSFTSVTSRIETFNLARIQEGTLHPGVSVFMVIGRIWTTTK